MAIAIAITSTMPAIHSHFFGIGSWLSLGAVAARGTLLNGTGVNDAVGALVPARDDGVNGIGVATGEPCAGVVIGGIETAPEPRGAIAMPAARSTLSSCARYSFAVPNRSACIFSSPRLITAS